MSTEPRDLPDAPPTPGDAPDPGPGEVAPAAASATTAEARRRRGRQTTLDMVRSMVVILAFVGVVLLLAPQPDAVEQPQLGTAEALLAQELAAAALGAEPLLLVPGEAEDAVRDAAEDAAADDATDDATDTPSDAGPVIGLGEGWRLDYARTEQTDEVETWRVGVLSPAQRRVDLEQAVDPTEEWLTRADTGRPGLPEPVELGGLTWTVQQRGDERTTYTWVDEEGAGGLTTAVSASSDSEDLRDVVEQVAAALED